MLDIQLVPACISSLYLIFTACVSQFLSWQPRADQPRYIISPGLLQFDYFFFFYKFAITYFYEIEVVPPTNSKDTE